MKTDVRRYVLIELPELKGLKGYVVEKIIKKFPTGNAESTSGLIFVPKRFIGKKFMLILVPEIEAETLRSRVGDDMKIWRL